MGADERMRELQDRCEALYQDEKARLHKMTVHQLLQEYDSIPAGISMKIVLREGLLAYKIHKWTDLLFEDE